jgi:hypothetical protein
MPETAVRIVLRIILGDSKVSIETKIAAVTVERSLMDFVFEPPERN